MEEHTFPKEKRRWACPGYSQFWFFSRYFFLPCFTGKPDTITKKTWTSQSWQETEVLKRTSQKTAIQGKRAKPGCLRQLKGPEKRSIWARGRSHFLYFKKKSLLGWGKEGAEETAASQQPAVEECTLQCTSNGSFEETPLYIWQQLSPSWTTWMFTWSHQKLPVPVMD